MGEYATHHGRSVKIGTCEDMYYLRATQRSQVDAEDNSVNVNDATSHGFSLRYRFPFPDEDHIAPGAFENHSRSLAIPGLMPPHGVGHARVQFRADAGYLASLPCPEGVPQQIPSATYTDVDGVRVARNGFSGAVHLEQQKLLSDGRLVPVCRCGGCGTKWRVEEPAEIERLVVACRAEADRRADTADFWHEIANRILAGAQIFAKAFV